MAYTGIIVDGTKEILENLCPRQYTDEICGPYVCTECGAKYKELKEGRQPLNMVPAGITGDLWLNTDTHTIYEPADWSLVSYDDQGARIIKTGLTKRRVLEEMRYYIIGRLSMLEIAKDYNGAEKMYKGAASPDRFFSDDDILCVTEGHALISLKDYTEHIQTAKNRC